MRRSLSLSLSGPAYDCTWTKQAPFPPHPEGLKTPKPDLERLHTLLRNLSPVSLGSELRKRSKMGLKLTGLEEQHFHRSFVVENALLLPSEAFFSSPTLEKTVSFFGEDSNNNPFFCLQGKKPHTYTSGKFKCTTMYKQIDLYYSVFAFKLSLWSGTIIFKEIIV